MAADVDGFLERFFAFGAAPSVESYLALFDPHATLFDSGMARPISVPEIPDSIRGVLAVIPDLVMVPERWRERNGTLFVEAGNRATIAGGMVQWRSVYCVDLAGDRVVRGRRYYDRRPLFARLDPSLPSIPEILPSLPEMSAAAGACAPPIADPIVDAGSFASAASDALTHRDGAALQRLFREDGCWWSAGRAEPVLRDAIPVWLDALAALLPDAKVDVETWAGDDTLVFLEWKASARLGGESIAIGGVDRFDLAAGLALHARSYFDTLDLANRLAALAGTAKGDGA
jgi:hypothetical protein